jgi:hypothetical protein
LVVVSDAAGAGRHALAARAARAIAIRAAFPTSGGTEAEQLAVIEQDAELARIVGTIFELALAEVIFPPWSPRFAVRRT